MLKLTVVALALLFIGSIADVPAMFLAARGMLPLGFILIVGFLADVLPDFFWYWLGGKIGIHRFSKLKFFRQEPKRLEKVDHAFHTYGGFILFFSKFVYLFGIPSQIVAGMHHYPLKKMVLANALGAASWLAVLYVLARIFSNTEVIETYLTDTKLAFLAFFVVALGIHFLLGTPMKRMLDRD